MLLQVTWLGDVRVFVCLPSPNPRRFLGAEGCFCFDPWDAAESKIAFHPGSASSNRDHQRVLAPSAKLSITIPSLGDFTPGETQRPG